MINSVKKIKDGKYLINEAVIISGISFEDNHIVYDIDYDKELITHQLAEQIGDEFIMKALVESSENV